MPRGKKDQGSAPPPGRVSKRKFMDFLGGVKDLRQDVDDANMKHAQEWKNADKLGIHPQATKWIARLDKMEDAKRTDMLRAFDLYRSFFSEWTAQGEMFDQPANGAAAEDADGAAGGEDEGDDDPAELAAAAEPSLPLPTSEQALQQEKEEDESADETPAEATEELAAAGFTFAAGRDAGERGDHADSNPHPEGSPSHPIWLRGHTQGVVNREQPENGVPLQPEGEKRRSRRAEPAAAESATVLH